MAVISARENRQESLVSPGQRVSEEDGKSQAPACGLYVPEFSPALKGFVPDVGTKPQKWTSPVLLVKEILGWAGLSEEGRLCW